MVGLDTLLQTGAEVVVNILWQLVIVVIILAVAVIVGRFIEKLVKSALNRVKLDEWVSKNNLQKPLGSLKLSSIGGTIVKWYVILIFILFVADLVNLSALANLLSFLAKYIPLAIVAIVIFVIGVLLARFVRNKISTSSISLAAKTGQVVEIVIIYLALVIALDNLGLQVQILETAFVWAFTAFAIVVAIIVGISFYPAIKPDVDTMLGDIKKMRGR